MSGDRHHILPRFLLKGFASRSEGGKIYTWVYPRNQTPVEANIRRVGVEKYFYGKQGELSVDDDLTKFEGKYAPLLDQLREHIGEIGVPDQNIAKFVTHLAIRTKHLRESMRESSEFMIEKISGYLSHPTNLKAAMLGKLGREEFKKSLKNSQIPRSLRRKSQKLFHHIVPAFVDAKKTEMQIFYKDMYESIKNSLPNIVKNCHNEGLSKGLTPDPRVEEYSRLRWFVNDCDGPLILGDVGCLFETKDNKFKSLNFKDDVIKNIFLPISDKRMLIGTSQSQIKSIINFKLINKEIIKNSKDFFICSKCSPDIMSLNHLIGTEAAIISKEELDIIARNVVSEYKKR